MRKILILSTVGLGRAGISSVIANYVSHMDRSGLQLEFTAQPCIAGEVLEQFRTWGPVRILPFRQKQPLAYFRALKDLMDREHYDAVHIHGNSGTMALDALLARTCGVKTILVHGHNTHCSHPLANRLLTPVMKRTATDLLACSQAAGRWLYGDGAPFTVLTNAIDPERFRFSPELRQTYRRELGLEGCKVVGHVGHFVPQKNHGFLLEVFEAAFRQEPALRLILAGAGPGLEALKQTAREKGLPVTFLGRRSDTAALYQAMDLFILPSLWEGLPVVLPEARAAGLPVLMSDCIPPECLGPLVTRKALSDGPRAWAEVLLSLPQGDRSARSAQALDDLTRQGFDIRREARSLEARYLR